MPRNTSIWCAHPCHDELLPNGKKRFWKTGRKPSHPKGKRSINHNLAEFINNFHQAIINGSSTKLSKGDYLCTSCFAMEERRFICDEDEMDIENNQQSSDCSNFDDGIEGDDSPNDDEYGLGEQEDAKVKLNDVFQLVNVKKIDDILVISFVVLENIRSYF